MKVLIINKFLYPNGGSETYIFKLGEALEKAGHEVQYFGMEHEGRCVGNAVNSYTSDMDFHGGSKLAKMTYPIKTIYSSEARKKIRLVLDDFKPDVVHLNNFNYQLTPSVILEIVKWRETNKCSCKIVYTAHDYQLLCPNHMFNNPNTHLNCEKCAVGHFSNCISNKCIHGSTIKSLIGATEAFYWNLRGTYKYIDKIVCCSQFMKSKLDMNSLFSGKTVAQHNFVEHAESTHDWYNKASSNATGNVDKSVILSDGTKLPQQYVLYFGRFSWEKGVRTLIDACNMLPEVDFVFAGSGDYSRDIDTLLYAQNVGFRTGDDLDKLIRNAMFTICPSECYENNPFSVMESQERLVPVIGANIGGIPELIKDEIDGKLFESGNAEALADAIKELWNHPEVVDNFRQNLRSVRLNRMNVDEYCDWIVQNVYK
ncbi:glycosyltransferase [Butyrivibrio sp. INlla14]|uniref:glycosyltransferase n=1 Tax=Butyrivibrio sp. INlla14 TaxID=1520808 RepID=UPI0008766F69|nr:glycosyltransferase [Butyrivibrio sp. INlla14]SCY75536.1 Glycosyltransferase involved in cell wall bisynthesis [Butyrivibrio sp. INlla14]